MDYLVHWIIVSLSRWSTDLFIQRLVQFHWFVDSLIHCFIDSLGHWFIASLLHWFIVSLLHGFIDSLLHLFIDSLVHCFVASLIRWFHSLVWLFRRLLQCFVPSSIYWLIVIDSSIHWFIDFFSQSCMDSFMSPHWHLNSHLLICSFVGAPHNFNTSLPLHLKIFPIL